jgi:hypothetical protein
LVGLLRGAPAECAVRPGGVVVVAEGVELGLQLPQGPGSGLAGEPFLEGLVEPFDLAAGLRVVGPGVPEADAASVQGDLEDHPAATAGATGEDRPVVAEHAGRISIAGSSFAETVVDVAGLEHRQGMAADADP